MNRYYSIFYIVILISFGIHSQTFAKEEFPINSVVSEERDFFLKYFREILSSDFGFVLIGAKPMALEEFSQPEFIDDPSKKRRMIEYLKILFAKSKRFSLRTHEDSNGPYSAILIDLKAFHKLKVDPNEELIFCDTDIAAMEHLALLFGYGKENGRFYSRYFSIGLTLNKHSYLWTTLMLPEDLLSQLTQNMKIPRTTIEVPYEVEYMKVSQGFSSLEEEWEWIIQNEMPISERDLLPPMWIKKPFFGAKNSRETQKLLKKYDLAADQLGKMLHNDNWFDLVLEKISFS